MRVITHTVKDPEGVHALTAGGLIKIANEYSCTVTAQGHGGSVDLKNPFAVMTLGIKCGEVITITCDGDDETEAEAALKQYMQVNL